MPRLSIGILCLWFMSISFLRSHGRECWTAPEENRKRRNPVAATAPSVRQGRFLYLGNCMLCHGKKSAGRGPWAKKLSAQPANFTDRQRMSKMTAGEIFWKITAGRDPMPSFAGKLSEEQRWHLVNYLRTLAPQEPQRDNALPDGPRCQ